MTWTFGLLRKAIGVKLGKDTGSAVDTDIPNHIDVDSAIGIPRDEMQYHRQVGSIRVNKVYTFLSHGAAKYMVLVWLVVASPIMVVHYNLFRHGKFYL